MSQSFFQLPTPPCLVVGFEDRIRLEGRRRTLGAPEAGPLHYTLIFQCPMSHDYDDYFLLIYRARSGPDPMFVFFSAVFDFSSLAPDRESGPFSAL